MAKRLEKEIIGWREWLALPELGIKKIKAKVDTGARTSSLHATKIVSYRRGMKEYVRFIVAPSQESTKGSIETHARVIDERWVKSSTGHNTLRPVIKTEVLIGKRRFETELTLVNRDMMGFRMLLGRQSLKEKYLVDSAKSFLLGKEAKKIK